MGKIDARSKAFFSNSRNFADLINGAIFNGKAVINPKDLVEMNVERINITDDSITSADIIKKWSVNGLNLAIIPIESQNYIDYGMVIRNMVNEALEYKKQVSDIISFHNKEKDINNSDEFLSGITKSDMLTPIITVVVYLGKKKWDGPRELYDMVDIDKRLAPYIYNYRINLVDYHDFNDFEMFYGEVKKLFTILSYRTDKNKTIEYFKKNKYMKYNTARLIGGLTGINTERFIIKTLKGDVIDMFEAMEEYYNDGVSEGIEKRN